MLGATMGEAGKFRRSAMGRRVVTTEKCTYIPHHCTSTVTYRSSRVADSNANVLQSLDYAGNSPETEIAEEEEEFDPPDGLEEEIDRLMGNLSDKVG